MRVCVCMCVYVGECRRKKERKIEIKGVFVRFERFLGKRWGNVRTRGRKWLKIEKNGSGKNWLL